MLVASAALANFHLFQIEQLFSNADGTVQFVVMHEFTGSNGEHLWGGMPLISTHAGVNKTFIFPNNLSSFHDCRTPRSHRNAGLRRARHRHAGFRRPESASCRPMAHAQLRRRRFGDVSRVPRRRHHRAQDHPQRREMQIQMIPNLATNFAGQSASVTAPGGPIIPVGGVWYNPAESGSGFGFDYQNGTLVVEVYSYLAGGAAQWYLAAGPVTNNVFTATLDKYTGGQCISCAYVAPSLAGNDGTITITFTSPTAATVDLPGGRHIQIQRFFQ
jgi:hypothetical protein